MSGVREDLKDKTPKLARELDRNQSLVRMLSLMTANDRVDAGKSVHAPGSSRK